MAARTTRASGRKAASQKKTVRPRSPQVPRSRRKKSGGDKGGRPAIEWTEQAAADVHKLARAGNTVADMALILEVSKRSLENAIAKEELIGSAYRLGCAERRDALRTAQLRVALRGNATMLIWLGKQELGQRDVKKVEVSGTDGAPLEVQGDLAPVVKQKLLEFLRSRGKGLE